MVWHVSVVLCCVVCLEDGIVSHALSTIPPDYYCLSPQFPGIQDSDPDPVGAHFVSNMEENSSSNNNNDDDDGIDDHHGLNCNGGNPNADGPVLLLPASTTYTTNTARFRSIDADYRMREENDNDEKYDDFENQSSTVASDTTLRLVRRRYGSGLGNLGNTCYMNSTLQCLAHTEPLLRYFSSGEFQNDLNRENPLGTGGKLAIQFAHLLAEMWGSKQLVRRGTEIPAFASDSGSDFLFSSSVSTVYPRQFKETLGNHAEQFRGYEQHDSQELAACLLDALHEDCNRVTQKPYVEKPEQAEHETDQEAADKAWQLHLQREDSRVLENFMGQIKSRLQCNTEGCGRVSTTFDPFMYLSVPIPGSENRRLTITFVPLDPARRPVKLTVQVNKSAALEDLVQAVFQELSKAGIAPPVLEDVVVCDMWQSKVFKWFDLSKNSVEEIRDNDETFIYELRPLSEVRQIEENLAGSSGGIGSDLATAESLGIRDIKRTKLYQLDVGTLAQVNVGDAWLTKLEHYYKSPLNITNAFNPRKGTADDRVRIYRRLSNFIDSCHQAIAEHEGAISRKQSVDNLEENGHATSNGTLNGLGNISLVLETEYIPGIVSKCDISQFRKVESKKDVAILEFLAGKVYQKIMEMERQRKDVFPDGVLLELRFRKGISAAAAPLVVRIPSTTTVFEFRNLVTHRLSRSLKAGNQREFATNSTTYSPTMNGNADNYWHQPTQNNVHSSDTATQGDWVMRRVPLSYERKSSYSSNQSGKPLGSIPATVLSADRRKHSAVYAEPDHPEEQESVAQIVGDYGTVCVDVTDDTSSYVDMAELEAVDVPRQSEKEKATERISVLDCIDKFCSMEQLEETEQWYCSKCNEFVCAWKQTHIYRSPPYLIIHLKRFQFTHRTHRRSKISEFVDFPLEGLDLTMQVLHWSDDEKPIYDCYAVSNHFGGLGGGHYTAHCLHDDGVWCYYDDSRITQNVDPKEVVTDAAYVLYYRRRGLPISPPFELKVPTPEIVATGPALIEDPLADSTAASADPASEMSSSANMVVDEDDGVMDLTNLYDSAPHDGSRSTSPASDNAAHDEYSYDDLSSHGDADESSNGGSEMLPLQ